MKQEKTEFLGIPMMGEAGEVTETPVWPLERWLMGRLLASLGNPPLVVGFWDGTDVRSAPNPKVGITLKDRRTFWRLIRHPTLNFGDDLSAGRIIVEGGLVAFLDTVFRHRPRLNNSNSLRRHLMERLKRVRRNTLDGSQENIHHHYDISNEFYGLWLDRHMQYTCAYFPDPEIGLEAAQLAKLDHVARKLQLKPGETVVEAGCGWGGLARHLARHYGVTVRAYNISREQVAYARERAAQEGLADRVEYVLDDYRNIEGEYDAFVSVGMLEHVGAANYRTLGSVIDRCLKPHGRGLIHSIGQNQAVPATAWTERRIFPGGYAPTLREMMCIFEPYDLSVLDVENLRLHYARTLEHWLDRYEEQVEQVRRMFDENFVRAWRLYLAASIASFTSGNLQLFQVVFSRPQKNDLPWSRGHLYGHPLREE